jgi:hypothetical protein
MAVQSSFLLSLAVFGLPAVAALAVLVCIKLRGRKNRRL